MTNLILSSEHFYYFHFENEVTEQCTQSQYTKMLLSAVFV